MSGGGGGRDDGYVGGVRSSGGGKADGPSTGGGGGPLGGGGGAGDGGGGDNADQCAIAQRAPLNSPVPAVVATLTVGRELDVVLTSPGGRAVLEVRQDGAVAGALTHRGHLTLIRCIENGWSYKAVVTNVSGGLVELRIQPA